MDISLDEFIKKKRIGGGIASKFATKQIPRIQKNIAKKFVVDARLRIIQKNRLKIRDARDKLRTLNRVGDARQKIIEMGGHLPLKRNNVRSGPYNAMARRALRLERKELPVPHKSAIIKVPRGYIDYDNMKQMEEEEYEAATRLSRTVRNDTEMFEPYTIHGESMPPPAPRRVNTWNAITEHYDPFDVYEPHGRVERRISPDIVKSRPTILQDDPDIYQRHYVPQSNSHLSYEMRARLNRAPDPHVSMGIFANSHKTTIQTMPAGYRIVVSNLHTSVNEKDIRELFEDIGPLYDSRIVRPGVAEVIYKSLDNAEKAVDAYHNRQLDGQPMKCLLVNPRASNKPTAPAIKTASSTSRNGLTKTPLEIDIDALHKVLFRRN